MMLTTTTGMSRVRGSAFSSVSTAQPLTSGSTMSRVTAAGCSSRTAASPSPALAASAVSKPASWRRRTIKRRMESSSSMTRTRSRVWLGSRTAAVGEGLAPPSAGEASLAPTPGSAARGRVNQKLLPRPTSDSTPMDPPWSSTRRRAIARPRPEPPNSRVVPRSACRNSSKMMARASGAMPMPVSLTVTRRWESVISALIRTLPSRVNLMALATRLVIACLTRSSSPSTW